MREFKYTKENLERFEKLQKRYPKIDSMMLPALWIAQKQDGWISPEAMVYIADKLGTSPMRVYEVATFYTMFNLIPVGKYHIEICKTLSCMLCGSNDIKNRLVNTLGIKPGESSKDGKFTLSEVECLGSCGTAPVVAINGEYHENLDVDLLDKIIEECK